MLTILLALEFAIMMAGASIVAWLRYPSRHSDDYRLGCLRYLAPPTAVLLLLFTILEFRAWQLGRLSGEPPPIGLALIGAVMMVISIIWAIVAVRKRRGETRSRIHGG